MKNITLFESDNHKFVLLNESKPGKEHGIRSNQYLVKHDDAGVLLDPGGFGVMPQVLSEMLRHTDPDCIKAIIFSHQDPDIVAGIGTWIELIKAPIYISKIWTRFLPHYGLRDISRFTGIPDEGMDCSFGKGFNLKLVPAHFLHSEGQFNVYDPLSKILFTGDIGTACMPAHVETIFVEDFDKHLPYIEWFHRRYMCSNSAARAWVDTISELDIEMIAPQHGPIYKGKAADDFINWFRELRCGTDLMSAKGQFRKEACDCQ